MHFAKNYTPVEISKTKLQHDLFDNPPMLFQGELNWHSSRAVLLVLLTCADTRLPVWARGHKNRNVPRPRSLFISLWICRAAVWNSHYFGILPNKGERSLPCCPIKIHRACRDGLEWVCSDRETLVIDINRGKTGGGERRWTNGLSCTWGIFDCVPPFRFIFGPSVLLWEEGKGATA